MLNFVGFPRIEPPKEKILYTILFYLLFIIYYYFCFFVMLFCDRILVLRIANTIPSCFLRVSFFAALPNCSSCHSSPSNISILEPLLLSGFAFQQFCSLLILVSTNIILYSLIFVHEVV